MREIGRLGEVLGGLWCWLDIIAVVHFGETAVSASPAVGDDLVGPRSAALAALAVPEVLHARRPLRLRGLRRRHHRPGAWRPRRRQSRMSTSRLRGWLTPRLVLSFARPAWLEPKFQSRLAVSCLSDRAPLRAPSSGTATTPFGTARGLFVGAETSALSPRTPSAARTRGSWRKRGCPRCCRRRLCMPRPSTWPRSSAPSRTAAADGPRFLSERAARLRPRLSGRRATWQSHARLTVLFLANRRSGDTLVVFATPASAAPRPTPSPTPPPV